MLIRSKSKQSIVNLDNIDTITVSSTGEIYSFNGASKARIGKYSTEEKAIKVLDMLQETYLQYGTISNNRGIYGVVTVPKIFQMPQDDEVEV